MLAPEIAAYLVAEGFGTLDVDVFSVPFTQDCADASVCVVDHQGRTVGTFGASLSQEAFQEGEFQVVVRGKRDEAGAARTKAEAIRAKLNRLGPVTLGSTLYLDVRASTVYWIRWDEEGRAVWGIRCDTEKN